MEQNEQYVQWLNEALSDEITVIIMYRWQSIVVEGATSRGLPDFLEEMSSDEVHHAMGLANKIDYFGGLPTFDFHNPILHTDPTQILQENVKRETDAIALYKRLFDCFSSEPGVQWMLQDFLHDEEGHHAQFSSYLDEIQQSPQALPTSNVMPLPSFMQAIDTLSTPMEQEVGAPGVIAVAPRIAAFAEHLLSGTKKRRHTQEAKILIEALTTG